MRVDGHRLYGACPNRMDPPAFHVDFAEIERIDVGKGPFDVARGGLAGVIDIVTREPEPGLHVEAQAAAGTARYFAPSLGVSYGGARWSAQAGASMRQGDPYSDGDGRSIVELAPAGSAAAYAPAVDGERATGRQLVGIGRAHDQRAGAAHLLVDHADGVVLRIVGTEGIGTDQLGERVGEVGLGPAHRPHLVQHHRHARLRELPCRFAAGEPAAHDMHVVA